MNVIVAFFEFFDAVPVLFLIAFDLVCFKTAGARTILRFGAAFDFPLFFAILF